MPVERLSFDHSLSGFNTFTGAIQRKNDGENRRWRAATPECAAKTPRMTPVWLNSATSETQMNTGNDKSILRVLF